MKRLVIVIGLCLLSITACSEKRPDLTRVYPRAMLAPRRPVIIIPGAFGSRLKDERTGEVVWGRFSNLLTRMFKLVLTPLGVDETDRLDLPIDSTNLAENRDHLRAFDLFDGVAGRAYYKRIVGTLVEVAGYHFGDIIDPKPGEDCFAFYYDWRRDVVENATMLGEAITRIRAVYTAAGTKPPKVDLIGHSLGGLIARYYVMYGAKDVLGEQQPVVDQAGARFVDTVVLIGVPNEGTLDSLESHDKGYRILRSLPAEAIFTMPAAYQALPRVRVKPFIDQKGEPIDIDLYEPSNWHKYGWSVFAPEYLHELREETVKEFGEQKGERLYLDRLTVMRTFHAAALKRAALLNTALDRRGRVEDTVKYFTFGGDCTPTPARAMVLSKPDGGFETIWRFDDVPGRLVTPEIEHLMVEPGDGSVTRSSLLATHTSDSADEPRGGLPLDYPLFLCGTHRGLTENMTFQDNLLHFLLYRR